MSFAPLLFLVGFSDKALGSGTLESFAAASDGGSLHIKTLLRSSPSLSYSTCVSVAAFIKESCLKLNL